jgi:hypothetical protein
MELSMRNLFLASALLALTPFAFLFALIMYLNTHNQSDSGHTYAYRQSIAYAAIPSNQYEISGNVIVEQNGKAESVRQFFARYNSPLEPYSVDVVNAADEYGLDYRLIPAIAMQESGACKKIPEGSNNCWGFGIYGGKVTKFATYKDGIYTVTKALATRYKSRGLVTPEEIMTMYTPSSNGSWAKSVNFFMSQIK